MKRNWALINSIVKTIAESDKIFLELMTLNLLRTAKKKLSIP